MEIIKCKISRGELINLENLLLRTKNLQIVDVNILVIENFSSYLDYYLPMLKVIITLIGRGKLANVRVILNTRAKVSVISLNTALRFEILITYSTGMALQTITKDKSRFIRFANNIAIIIRNTIIRTWFYIIDSFGIKVILGFLFIQKARVIFRYPRNKEDRLVFALLYDPRTGDIISIKTNIEIEKV